MYGKNRIRICYADLQSCYLKVEQNKTAPILILQSKHTINVDTHTCDVID